MSMRPQLIPEVPEETAEVARRAFPKGNIYVQMRDALGSIYTDVDFADLYPASGQAALSPWRLALVTVMQYVENLSDRQAAEAVRDRIAWKYALSLRLTDEGFDYSVLSEFRSRLLASEHGERLLDILLRHCQQIGLLKARGSQRTDSTHVLAAVRNLNRLENVGETLRHTLNCLAVVVPEWLASQVSPAWYERYSKRMEQYRLPKSAAQQAALAQQIGQDGYALWEALVQTEEMVWLRQIPAVETFRQVWLQQYWVDAGQVRQREVSQMPPGSAWIRSPYDTEARYSTKRQTEWVGYRVHLTETCDLDAPRLITQVMTTPATHPDSKALAAIQADLCTKDLLPQRQLVDEGYVNAANLVMSQQHYQIELIGPVPKDTSWQAQAADTFDLTHFRINWQQRQVTCPAGKTNQTWCDTVDRYGEPISRLRFAPHHCHPCLLRPRCTPGKGARGLTLRPQVRHEALQAARRRETTPAFKDLYPKRAGIEGSLSEAIRDQGLRKARYVGLTKTHLQALVTATAINLTRLLAWLDELPLAQTRKSHFARLAG